MMRCPKCGTLISNPFKGCPICGWYIHKSDKRSTYCPVCGATIVKYKHFKRCPVCHARVTY